MSPVEFTFAVLITSITAGFLGSLTGLGGGIVITPILTLVFGVKIEYAIGATLVSVIATSSGAAAAYVREGFSNIRVGMFLEIATTAGAVSGAMLAEKLPVSAIFIIFGLVLLQSAYISGRPLPDRLDSSPADPWGTRLKMNSTFPTVDGPCSYQVHHVGLGFGVMYIAGILSGLLGIGSGALKVIGMDQAMRLPFKVSTTTSNFMIGVTAAASAGIYLRRGYIHPGLSMPVMLGVLAGATLGTRFLIGAKVPLLRVIFGIVVAVLAVEMVYHGIAGVI
ncbi:MAG: sulfite exporter TauE/SafE family protein [Acidobacteria bacterium]|nr:sulfite exporter TauE/SafE family protein [Acidobacteriota bacterium]